MNSKHLLKNVKGCIDDNATNYKRVYRNYAKIIQRLGKISEKQLEQRIQVIPNKFCVENN